MPTLKGAMAGSSTQQIFLNFIFGLIFGSIVTFVVIEFSEPGKSETLYLNILSRESSLLSLIKDPHGNTHVEVNDHNQVSEEEASRFVSHLDSSMLGEDALSGWMVQHVRILCWVMTNPKNLQSKAIHVKSTWAKRCNKVLFISSEDTDFPTVAVVDHEGREYLWQKTRGAFQHIYDNYLNEADWFLKADDDTYVIVENLRKLVSTHSPNEPIFFGRKFKPYVRQGYMSGGAGYILSHKAVELLVEKGFSDPKLCKPFSKVGGAEDVDMGRCLMNVGVTAGDSRTGEYETFHPFVPSQMIVPNILPRKFWYWDYNYYPVKEGPECCSDFSISFHYVAPNVMYQLEYMIYHMRPFGVGYYSCPADIRSIVGLPEVTGSESSADKAETVVADEKIEDEKKETGAEVKDKDEKKKTEGEAAIDLTKQKQAEEKEEKRTGEEEETAKGGGKENAAQSGE